MIPKDAVCKTCEHYQPPERAAPKGVIGTCHEPGNLVGRPTGVYAVLPGEKCKNWVLREAE